MRHILTSAVAVVIIASPVWAEEEDATGLIKKGARLLFEGLMQEMEPRIEDLGEYAEEFGPKLKGFVREMGPALQDLVGEVQDWSQYHPPEVLPNGDIIIRRKSLPETGSDPDVETDI